MLESATSDDYVRTTRRPPQVRIRTAMAVEKRAFSAEVSDSVVANDSPGAFWTDAK
jgi:hypothetical protein